MQVGFIGTGSMGSVLIDAFIRSGAFRPQDITASNRTETKVLRLAADYPGLNAAANNRQAATGRDIVFLCIRPHDFHLVLDEIRDTLHSGQIIVSITSPVLIRCLEEKLPCKIAKIIPSITNLVRGGAVLCIYGERLDAADRERLDALFEHIGRPVAVTERHTRIASDLSSCGPAFFAHLLGSFIDAAATTGMPRTEAERLAAEMLLGTARLLTEGGFTPEALEARVAVPGGITAAGLAIMQKELGGMFSQLIRMTHAKYDEDLAKVEASFARLPDSTG